MTKQENNLTHGGDWSGRYLDFSANVSPLGVPDGVRRAIYEASASADRYPDPLCRRLRDGIAGAEGLPPEWILCGNGAADLIVRTALAVRPRRAVVTAPSFSEYEAALKLSGCGDIVRFPLREAAEFRLDGTFLDALTMGTDLTFLCQPNNPTGVTIPRPLLAEILRRCREIDCTLVVDECFLGFLDSPGGHTLADRLGEFPNLLILRAFTKLYGMAGVRLGYALCSDVPLLERLQSCGPPWSVSSLAQTAGLAALRETDYVSRVRSLVSAQRPRLYDGLNRLGLRVVPGEANFLLFRSPVPLEIPLRERGILLRNCGNFYGLDEGWYRTAVRTEEENTRLLAALADALRESKPYGEDAI